MHESGVPWLLAELDMPLDKPARIRLSISYTNYRFARAFIDAFDAGLDAAQHLNAHLIEQHTRSEVTAENVEDYLSDESDYAKYHLKHWQEVMSEMNVHNHAPLEFAIGHFDCVREYFCLSVLPPQPVDADKLSEDLGYSLRMRSESNSVGAICDPVTKRPKCKILFRPDGKIQLQPFYWKESFAAAAGETLEIATAIKEKYAAQLLFFSEPVNDELHDTLLKHIDALGVDFYWWVGDFFHRVHAADPS
jgi:hypothetical protein